MINVIDDCIPIELQNYFEAITLGKVNDVEIDPIVEFKSKYEPTAWQEKNKPIKNKLIIKPRINLSKFFHH